MKNFIDDYPRDYPEPETTARLLHNHFKIKEIPVQMRERQGGVSSISPGKIHLLYGKSYTCYFDNKNK